ncbi:hypothetical protein [Hymenobacter metallicola]|uniref:Tetratricopeptide repeat protein n=1 Tax=Hymenobacter metallicola TaxID=2563114 RepID=A0A4Z0QF88_9BACT|nr:hypothetical protein [Hymenobacter metallicola]TGE28414.1 hypothetical protein E5K02_02815 [Hymenobacter metallicola]
MTRASLLQILDHVSAISESEIRELEQLAAAFPYCQTAHVLLAKAAHDQGSMLASQRLRRAATYATDRQLLRQLIEQPTLVAEPVPAAALLLPAAPLPVAEVPVARLPNEEVSTELEAPVATPQPAEAQQPTTAAPDSSQLPAFSTEPEQPAPEADAASGPGSSDVEASEAQNLPEPGFRGELAESEVTSTQEDAAPAHSELITEEATEPVADFSAQTETVITFNAPEEEPQEAEGATVLATPAAAEAGGPEAVETEHETLVAPTEPEALSEEAEVPALVSEETDAAAPVLPEAAEEDILPPVAPPIRPPVEAGSSRFEFGLGFPDPSDAVLYELPLPSEDEAPISLPRPAVAGFGGDDMVGYALGSGSRYGYSLQPIDEFTVSLPDTEFFPPDALLHEVAPRYQPAPPPPPSPFDLINTFLRNQPRLRTPAVVPASAEEQADLSVRSTQVVPDLASESLAKIMVRQGKLHKAIEIYERLMVRQPEKKAYFADQIQQLKSTE